MSTRSHRYPRQDPIDRDGVPVDALVELRRHSRPCPIRREHVGHGDRQLNLITEDDLAMAIAESAGIEHLSIRNLSIDPNVVNALPEVVARKYKVFPIAVENSSVTVKTTSFRAAVNIPGCIERNSSERKSAVLEAAKAVEKGVCPWSNLCRTQLEYGSIILVATTPRCTVKVSALVKRKSAVY